ncbi:hypothetical protein ACV3YD_00930 [Clostridium perfringens]|uniref:hypothetical protein n=1 Tax=Clostridium perfringens TaxID=1502 RepID=UPI0013E3C324|nr:hypothetical protein [Clostridium perfringens]MDK0543566.1 hypothetical protein [Clostridium perfringens]MDK0646944.1 hypothetical protein [Clostridium perfringens]MDK0827692.1 hypothetical protein [Clostridium perfringens]MDM0778680.1 hypothetical protein [Clostridium perfringens]MDM0822562.1 hypothetical protein [Clostridium perfringens]
MMTKIQMDKKSFEKENLRFRKYASDLLKTNERDFHNKIKIFFEFINNSNLIKEFINNNNIFEYDILEAINTREDSYPASFIVSSDTQKAFSFSYQMIKFCAECEDKYALCNVYLDYGGNSSFDEMVKNFNNHIPKILIDDISLYFQERRVDMKEDGKIVINVNGNGGQVIYGSENSQITATQNNNFDSTDSLNNLFEGLKKDLLNVEIDKNDKEELIEATELAIETSKSDKPKKTIIKTAISGLKELVEISSLGIALTNNANGLIEAFNKIIS